MFVYHNFTSAVGGKKYGDEFDAVAVKNFGKHYQVLAKYAYYEADGFGKNTQKIWLQGNINF